MEIEILNDTYENYSEFTVIIDNKYTVQLNGGIYRSPLGALIADEYGNEVENNELRNDLVKSAELWVDTQFTEHSASSCRDGYIIIVETPWIDVFEIHIQDREYLNKDNNPYLPRLGYHATFDSLTEAQKEALAMAGE